MKLKGKIKEIKKVSVSYLISATIPMISDAPSSKAPAIM
jgi:hypothetical protein